MNVQMKWQPTPGGLLLRTLSLTRVMCCCHSSPQSLQDGRWVIFNDEKVAASEHPPLSLGYMYVYTRIDDQAQ
jgi:hypothetical protein